MEENDFLNLEYDFIDKLHCDPTYIEYINLSNTIEHDSYIQSLLKKRSELLNSSYDSDSKDKKKELQIEFKKVDDELKSIDIIKRYLNLKKELNELFKPLNIKIMEILKDD